MILTKTHLKNIHVWAGVRIGIWTVGQKKNHSGPGQYSEAYLLQPSLLTYEAARPVGYACGIARQVSVPTTT